MACITDKSSSKKYFMNEKEYTQLQNTRKEQEKSKHILISWLQSPSAVILELPK